MAGSAGSLKRHANIISVHLSQCVNGLRIKNMLEISLHRLSAMLLLVFALSMPFTRMIGGLNLIVFFFAALAISFRLNAVRKLPRSLLLFCLLALAYVVFSLMGLLPRTWTRYFEVSAIPQQALFLYAMPTTILVVLFYISKKLHSVAQIRELAAKLFFTWVAVKVIGILIAAFYPSAEEVGLLQMISISGMGTTSSLVIVAAALYLGTISKPLNRVPIILAFIAFSLISPFSQNKIFALVFALIWVFPRHSFKILLALILISVMVYFYGYLSPYSLYGVDQNLTVRVVLLRDAISGFFDSGLMGVGFGTEAISNYYALFGNPVFHNEEESGFIHLAHHNSFATVAFRLGVVGLALFLFFTYQTIKEVGAEGACNERAVKCSAFLAFFVVVFLNPALESFVYLYGVCLYLGVIWAFSYSRSIMGNDASISRRAERISLRCSQGLHESST